MLPSDSDEEARVRVGHAVVPRVEPRPQRRALRRVVAGARVVGRRLVQLDDNVAATRAVASSRLSFSPFNSPPPFAQPLCVGCHRGNGPSPSTGRAPKSHRVRFVLSRREEG